MQYKVNKSEKGKVEVDVEILASDFDRVYKETVEAFSKVKSTQDAVCRQ